MSIPKNQLDRDEALTRAIAEIGGYTATADALGITPASVHNWRKCPLHWVKRLAEISGVPAWELAPDHYDPPAQDPA